MLKELVISAFIFTGCVTSNAHADDITVISFGGAMKDAQAKAFYTPFENAKLGKVIAGEYNGEMARIRAMVETGQVGWDVVEVESPALKRGCDEGLFEPLNWDALGDKNDFVPASVSECGVGIFVWSTVLSYDADKVSIPPKNWADFWDIKKIPGKRGLRKSAKLTLEIALLADGVKHEDIYKVLSTPEGIDQAFAKLDELKSDIQWWQSGAQPAQWLSSGDVVLTAAYNGRITQAKQEGHHFDIVWQDSIYDIDFWAIVVGSKHIKTAEEYIKFASQPSAQKALSEAIPYGPTNLKASELIDPSIMKSLPTAPNNLRVSLSVNTEFWVEHGEELEQRFNAWAAR